MEVYNINCYWTKRAELKETSLWTITCMELSDINCYRTEGNQFVNHTCVELSDINCYRTTRAGLKETSCEPLPVWRCTTLTVTQLTGPWEGKFVNHHLTVTGLRRQDWKKQLVNLYLNSVVCYLHSDMWLRKNVRHKTGSLTYMYGEVWLRKNAGHKTGRPYLHGEVWP